MPAPIAAPVRAPARRKSPPRRRFPPEVLSEPELRALLAAVGGPPASKARNRALIAFLYRSGLRIAEALALRPKDVDASACSVRVLFAKGGGARTVGIDPGALVFLSEWVVHRDRIAGLPADAPLFCSGSGRAVTTAYVRRLLPELGRRAGIAKRVHAHGLRHTHAAELRSEGVDIGIISKQLGHRSILTTIRYLDHIAPTAVIEALAKRTW